MKNEKYAKIRKKLRCYRVTKKELEARTRHIEEFRKILMNPLPATEHTLRKIYAEVIDSMEAEAKKLSDYLKTVNNVLQRLEGSERSIIYFRYIEGIDWITMPEYMHYEQRNCQNIEGRALEKISKMNIDWGVEENE